MQRCPNPACAYRVRHGFAAAFQDHVERCRSCAGPLEPAPVEAGPAGLDRATGLRASVSVLVVVALVGFASTRVPGFEPSPSMLLDAAGPPRFLELSLEPALAWLIAATIRVSVGSATVSGLTAAGIVLPIVGQPGVSPELMVLAIGAGSIFFSHVNDGGFWLFKEYFNLSVKDTIMTWSLMETTVSVVGLLGVLLLDIWV